ncbi:MAG: hypothetical protein B7Y95_22510 [Rhizobiales bacterium 32-66-11]|nr:MAG: hypothetical protein B7Y95_22510 [Rhizobiales bacterium 32-66-11]
MENIVSGYVSKRSRDLYRPPKGVRVVLIAPEAEVAAVDAWGVPAGKASRAEAIRFLIKKGLEAVSDADQPSAPPVP